MKYKVYYLKDVYFHEYIHGVNVPQLQNLADTHVFLREVEACNPNDLFDQCQGEEWSPNGEARELIQEKGLSHTSMSVGDILEDELGRFLVVRPHGYKLLHPKSTQGR